MCNNILFQGIYKTPQETTITKTIICYRIVDPHEVEVASSMMAAFLGVGLACGSFLGLGLVKLL